MWVGDVCGWVEGEGWRETNCCQSTVEKDNVIVTRNSVNLLGIINLKLYLASSPGPSPQVLL